jgi:hypothetical protein
MLTHSSSVCGFPRGMSFGLCLSLGSFLSSSCRVGFSNSSLVSLDLFGNGLRFSNGGFYTRSLLCSHCGVMSSHRFLVRLHLSSVAGSFVGSSSDVCGF